tara:strand:+ start:85 stop:957 length:873 start_codon:yes stop_codon:yes gene_type:complete
MNILILGSNGMLGSSLMSYFNQIDNKVLAVSRSNNKYTNNDFFKIDFLDKNCDSKLKSLRSFFNPDVVINCAGITSLEYCEKFPHEADLANGEINSRIKKTFNDSKIIYVSTDSVFDGEVGNYNEDSKKNPLNKYAESKSLGEDIILEANNSIVLRTNIYGLGKGANNSLLNWAADNFKKNISIKGFDDYIFNPVHLIQVGEGIKKLIERDYKGIIHFGSKEHLSKYDFLKLTKNYFVDSKSEIKKVSSELPKDGILRPKNTTLDCNLFKTKFNYEFSIIDGLNKIIWDN